MNIIKQIILESNHLYNLSMLCTGNQIYIKLFDGVVFINFEGNGGRNSMSDNKVKNRTDAVLRAKRTFMMLVQSNFNSKYDKFITLTFKENMTDLSTANNEFKKFIKRLKYEVGNFKYIAVIEFQKRGSIHYHMIADLSYIKNKDLTRIWSAGFVKINRIKHVDDLGAYLIKYMIKKKDIWRLAAAKSYLCSENLVRPKALHGIEAIKKINELGLKEGNLTYTDMYERPDGKGNSSNVSDMQFVIKKNKKFRSKRNCSSMVCRELLEFCKKLSGESR